MKFIYKHKNKLFVSASILILIPFLFNIGLGEDEPFTMGIIQHSYPEIVKLTTMDVHPPLYYFVLKFFLTLTTFWTSNIFIKIIFARLLSVIFAAITFIYLLKTLNLLNIKYNKYTNLFLFMILPLNLGMVSQLAHIRMYSLGMCLGIIELYYLLQLLNHSEKFYYIIITLSVFLSMYNNYYLSITSGIYIILFLIYFMYKKEYKKSLYLFVCGFIPLLLFIPWIPHFLIQSTASSDTISTKRLIRTIIEYLFIIIICTPLLFTKKKFSYKLIIWINLYISFAILVTNILINPSVTSIRYMGTPLLITLIISLNIYINNLSYVQNKFKSVISIIILILTLNFMDSMYKQIVQYNLPSISFVKKFNKIKRNPNQNIDTNKYNLEKYIWSGAGNSIYLESINKTITNHNYVATGCASKKLNNTIFYNVRNNLSKNK